MKNLQEHKQEMLGHFILAIREDFFLENNPKNQAETKRFHVVNFDMTRSSAQFGLKHRITSPPSIPDSKDYDFSVRNAVEDFVGTFVQLSDAGALTVEEPHAGSFQQVFTTIQKMLCKLSGHDEIAVTLGDEKGNRSEIEMGARPDFQSKRHRPA